MNGIERVGSLESRPQPFRGLMESLHFRPLAVLEVGQFRKCEQHALMVLGLIRTPLP
jgi:hypothetical protein